MRFILEERFILTEDEVQNTDTTEVNQQQENLTWEQRYENCKSPEDFEVFWNGGQIDPRMPEQEGYFKEAWGENATEISGLGSQFMKTLVEIGWEETTNPFVAYLKKIIAAKRPEIPNRPSMNNLIKAYQDGKLSDQDLRQDGSLKEYNLIYNGLFTTSPADQATLLGAQANFINGAKAKIQEFGGNDLGIAFANIYSARGNTKNLSQVISEQERLSLRSTKEIVALVAKITGKTANQNTEATDQLVQNILNKVSNAETAKKAISYLYDIVSLNTPEIITKIDAEAGHALTNIKNKVLITASDSNALKKLFGFPNTSYSAQRLTMLITGLIDKTK